MINERMISLAGISEAPFSGRTKATPEFLEIGEHFLGGEFEVKYNHRSSNSKLLVLRRRDFAKGDTIIDIRNSDDNEFKPKINVYRMGFGLYNDYPKKLKNTVVKSKNDPKDVIKAIEEYLKKTDPLANKFYTEEHEKERKEANKIMPSVDYNKALKAAENEWRNK